MLLGCYLSLRTEKTVDEIEQVMMMEIKTRHASFCERRQILAQE
jgi:hypothetical protein